MKRDVQGLSHLLPRQEKSASLNSTSTRCKKRGLHDCQDLPPSKLCPIAPEKRRRTNVKNSGFTAQQRKVLYYAFENGYLSNNTHYGPLSEITGLTRKQISNWARKKIKKSAKVEQPKESPLPLDIISEQLVDFMRENTKTKKYIEDMIKSLKRERDQVPPITAAVPPVARNNPQVPATYPHNCRNSSNFFNPFNIWPLIVPMHFSVPHYEMSRNTISAQSTSFNGFKPAYLPFIANLHGVRAPPNINSSLSTDMLKFLPRPARPQPAMGCGLTSSGIPQCTMGQQPEACNTNSLPSSSSNHISRLIDLAVTGFTELDDRNIAMLRNITFVNVDAIKQYLLSHGWDQIKRRDGEGLRYLRR